MGTLKKYPEYRKSDMDFIQEIPETWDVKKLKFISNVQLSNVDKKAVEGEEPVLLCNYVDVYYNDKINSQIKFMKATAKTDQVKKFTLKRNDVLITKDSEAADDIGVPAWVEEDMQDVLCGYHLAQIRPYSSIMNGRYLYYCIASNGFRDQFWSLANGVTRFGISLYDIKNALFFIPTLEEQQTIANFLDEKTAEIDALIADKERLISLLEEKRQAIITEAVTKGLNPHVEMKDSGLDWIGKMPEHWDLKRLKFLFKIKKEISYEENPTILSITQKGIKVKDISNNEGQIADTYVGYQKVEVNDFVMNHMDLLTGFVDCSRIKGVTSPDYRVFRLTERGYIREYFLYYFQMCYFRRIFYRFGQGVSKFGRWRLQSQSFKEFIVPVPTISEQKEIVRHIEEQLSRIVDLINDVKKVITKLKEYRQSLIYEAVTGKIDVRDYNKVMP